MNLHLEASKNQWPYYGLQLIALLLQMHPQKGSPPIHRNSRLSSDKRQFSTSDQRLPVKPLKGPKGPHLNSGPNRPHKHKNLTFWFQGPIHGEYQISCLVGSSCSCDLLGPVSNLIRISSKPSLKGVPISLETAIGPEFLHGSFRKILEFDFET